jgi:hypothetical protein
MIKNPVNVGYIARHLKMPGDVAYRCGRHGRYSTAKLLAKYGADATLQRLQEDLTKDCPHKVDSHWPFGKCAPLFPDLRSLPINQPREER